MDDFHWDTLIIIKIFVLWLMSVMYYMNRKIASDEDVISIPLPPSLHKIFLSNALYINYKQKCLTYERPAKISLQGLIGYIYIAVLFIIYVFYFIGVHIYDLPRAPFLGWLVFGSFMFYMFAVMIYRGISGKYLPRPITPDKKYRYNKFGKITLSKKEKQAIITVLIEELNIKKRIEIPLQLPENIAESYEDIFGKINQVHWWVILENADSENRYIATIGVWAINAPNRLFEYAVDIENGTSALIRDYIENPEERS